MKNSEPQKPHQETSSRCLLASCSISISRGRASLLIFFCFNGAAALFSCSWDFGWTSIAHCSQVFFFRNSKRGWNRWYQCYVYVWGEASTSRLSACENPKQQFRGNWMKRSKIKELLANFHYKWDDIIFSDIDWIIISVKETLKCFFVIYNLLSCKTWFLALEFWLNRTSYARPGWEKKTKHKAAVLMDTNVKVICASQFPKARPETLFPQTGNMTKGKIAIARKQRKILENIKKQWKRISI